MNGKIAIDKLKEHPKNGHYFTNLEGEKYEEVKRSIEVNGIRDPIKCTTAYTVVSGHQRLRIAKELGFQEIPAQIVDVDEWEAEYLLIAENVERRGQAETDPIKKSRIANFLKEYWEISQGKRNDLVNNSRSSKDIADAIGESVDNTKRIMKLNGLIPELQQLVTDGKIGATAGEQLAYLTEDEQRVLLSVKGEFLENTTVQDAKDYRKEAGAASQTNTDFAEHLRALEEENDLIKKQLDEATGAEQLARQKVKELENQEPKVIEKVVHVEDKEEVNKVENILKKTESDLKKLTQEKEDLEHQMNSMYITKIEIQRMKENIRNLGKEEGELKKAIEDVREINDFIYEIKKVRAEGMSPLVYSEVLNRLDGNSVMRRKVTEAVESVEEWCRDMNNILYKENKIIEMEG